MVERLYQRQKLRGQEGFGYVSLINGVMERYRKAENEAPILKSLKDTLGNEVMFHHRKPTSTPNFWEAAHPIQVSHESLKYDYIVVHNGSIYDRDVQELKKKHDEMGFTYLTLFKQKWVSQTGNEHQFGEKWNDSECFAIELARDLDKDGTGISHVWGKIAFVCIQFEKDSKKAVKLFWGRNEGSPLQFSETKGFFTVTSEGDGKDMKAHILNWYDYATNKLEEKSYRVGYFNEYNVRSTYNLHEDEEWDMTSKQWVPKNEVKKTEVKLPSSPIPPITLAPISSVIPSLDDDKAVDHHLDKIFDAPIQEDPKRLDVIAQARGFSAVFKSREDQDEELERIIKADHDLKDVIQDLRICDNNEERLYLISEKIRLEGIIDEFNKKYPTISDRGLE